MNSENNNTRELQKLVEEFLAWKIKNNPTMSTMYGYNDYNGELEDFSLMEQSLEELKRFNRELDTLPINLIEDLDSQIDYELLRRDIENNIRVIEKFEPHILDPCTYSDLALQSISLLNNREDLSLEEKTGFIIKRMSKIPDLLLYGMKRLNNPPKSFVEAAINSCHGGDLFLPNLVSALEKEFSPFSEELNSKKNKLLECLEEYRLFLQKNFADSTGEYAVGKELFDELLWKDYMLDYNSKEVLEIGEEIFRKTQKQLQKLASRLDPHKSWKDLYFNVRLKHPEPEKIVETYAFYMEKAKRFVVEKDLMDIPLNEDVVVKPSPEFMRMIMPTAAYNPPALLQKFKRGIFMVTPVDTEGPPDKVEAHLRDHNIAEIITTTLHEAYPGHHLQLTYASRHPGLMRRHVFTPIFAEGWALYCEQLMQDYGYFDDPLVELCCLRRVLWRALRVIIDVSLHTRGMTIDEGVKLMVEELLFSEGSARGEVIRYTMMPTQPLSYLTGKLELLKIREEYQKMKGENYSIKKFHQDLLSCGTLPIRLLRKALLSEK
ncbi:MAG TPA: DUF885 domain-containing protein [Candidatus Eremiobacteraeota bacterium]|nr:MAG: hypothetical protein BWY64_01303 [bacterium ADurb.Bin363]HPZ08901.1 DUF885 domain-containing protein [Candidatus Eremiobacteraeota bacterium]